MSPFRYYFRVKFHECDPQGVVFNARYAEYASVAACEFLRALGRPEGPSCTLVRQVLEWQAAASFDQVLEAAVWARELGRSSFVIVTEFRRDRRDALLARVESMYVFIDRVSRSSRALPPHLRDALASGAPGRRVDHAQRLVGTADELMA